MIISFLLQDIPRHPDTRLFEVREAFKRSLLLDFQAHIRACMSSGGPCGGLPRLRRATRAAGVLRCAQQTPNQHLMPWYLVSHECQLSFDEILDLTADVFSFYNKCHVVRRVSRVRRASVAIYLSCS